jgi:two-component system OmpR family response regulator
VLEGSDTYCPDGLALVRKLRREGYTFPIIMVSKTDLSAVKVLALRSGADDYITKPYVKEEVAARIEAIMRRQKTTSQERALLGIDFDTFSVCSQGRSVSLTAKEFRIMETLISRPDAVVSRDMLVRRVWLNNDNVSNRVIDNHIGALRRKLEEVYRGSGEFLQTVHGIGYKLTIPEMK